MIAWYVLHAALSTRYGRVKGIAQRLVYGVRNRDHGEQNTIGHNVHGLASESCPKHSSSTDTEREYSVVMKSIRLQRTEV